MKNVLDAILQCPPSTDNQHLRCQSQLRSPEISFCSRTPVEVANKYIAIILGKPSIISFQIWSAKVLGGALQIFNFPFKKTISAMGGWDRVSTSHNCFD